MKQEKELLEQLMDTFKKSMSTKKNREVRNKTMRPKFDDEKLKKTLYGTARNNDKLIICKL